VEDWWILNHWNWCLPHVEALQHLSHPEHGRARIEEPVSIMAETG